MAVAVAAPMPAGAAALPEPRLEELVGNTRRHVQWHGMERALSVTERVLERLGAERAWAQQERLATRNSLYAMTTPRRVNRPPLTAPARGSRPGSSYKERSRAREEELKKQASGIHDLVVFTPEIEEALVERLCQPKPRPPAQQETRGKGSIAWAAAKDCRATVHCPWPHWHTIDLRPGGRKLLDQKGSGRPMHGTVAIADDHARVVAASDDTPSVNPPSDPPHQPQPPKGIRRKGTPSDRKWHNFGTPTRALERRMGEDVDNKPVGKPTHRAPAVWSWGGGHHSVVRGRSTRAIDLVPGRSRVHGQYVLRKEQTSGVLANSTGASPLSASCAARGYVPATVATTAEPTKYAEMKAWILAMSEEVK